MNITDMLFGHKRLTDMGFSPAAIHRALSEKEYSCESEVIEAVRSEQEQIDRRNYDAIRYQPGYYWTRGVISYRDPTRWWMVRVEKPLWTKESGKDHCRWFYMDGSGGYEIESGEWVLIPEPSTPD